jgi:glycosyltransferase involved in cell wall biosynthesis
MMRGISIIIPTYNRENFIEETIQSVLNQDYVGILEIIISDDGSSDRTLQIAESFGERVLILRKPVDCFNQGASSTRNRGISIATQPYICFLDSDDFFLPGHLRKITSFMDSNPDLYFTFCRVVENIEQDDYRIFKPWTKKKMTRKNILYPIVSGNNIVCTDSFVFKRSVFEKVGVFNETYTNGEDADMWLRITEQFRGGFSDHFGVVRRKHGINQLTFNPLETIRKNHYDVYRNAINRGFKSGQSNLYCFLKLLSRIIKYKLYGLKMVSRFEHLYSYRKYLSNFLIKNQRHFIRKNSSEETIDYNELLHFYEGNDLNVKYIIIAANFWEEQSKAVLQVTLDLAKRHRIVFFAANKKGIPAMNYINYQNNILVIQPFFVFDRLIRSRLPLINEIYQIWLCRKLVKRFQDAEIINFDPTVYLLHKTFKKVYYSSNNNFSSIDSKSSFWLNNGYRLFCEKKLRSTAKLFDTSSNSIGSAILETNDNFPEIISGVQDIDHEENDQELIEKQIINAAEIR